MAIEKENSEQKGNAVEGQRVIPVVREEVRVDKRKVETGVTRVRKILREHEEMIDTPLRREAVHVERVPVNRYLEKPLPVRQEDGATIVPVMEEVLYVEKRLLLKEELRITKKVEAVSKPQRVVLRDEEVLVERADARKDRSKGR